MYMKNIIDFHEGIFVCVSACKLIDYGLKKVLLPTPREFCRRSLS